MTNFGKWLLIVTASFSLLAGCVENNSQTSAEETMGEEKTVSEVGVVELPASIIAPAIADLVARIGVNKNKIRVLHAIAVVWNDSSLGCPQPGHSYTQVLVHGFWVVLEHSGRRYSYHAGNKGKFRLCTNAPVGPLGTPPGGRRDPDV